MPTFVASAIIGMISGALASIIESIGGYFAAARMVAAPPVPSDGVNRGILMEGRDQLTALFGPVRSSDPLINAINH